MEMLLTILLTGDVMLGRGVDQILPHSVAPELHEPYVRTATRYVDLAERASAEIDAPVDHDYVWGDALAVLDRVDPQVRLINLETAVTTSDEHWRGKGIHYRMHPKNVPTITAAGIDACVLGNNHVLDWGYPGLRETVASLRDAGLAPVGAGEDFEAAFEPIALPAPDDVRVRVFAVGMPTSGVPASWAARDGRPGVGYLPDLSGDALDAVKQIIEESSEAGDVIIFSVHWGGNWGYDIPGEQIDFAHRLIDEAGVDIVYGHSSHHPKGIEVYHGRLILYGCGDLINDYEGIGGHESYRPELTALYLPAVTGDTGELRELRLSPMRIEHLRLNDATEQETQWLRDRLNRESNRFGVRFEIDDHGDLLGSWGG